MNISSSRSFFNGCCGCFLLHQGYMNIVYLDTARVFWGIIYALLVFTRDDSYPIDKILDSFSLFAIAIQVFSANISLKYGLPRNNWKQHRIYFFTKLLYCLTHLLEHTIKDSVICTYNLLSANCGRAFKYQLIAVIFWFMIELYFTMVVYHFYKNTRKGEYGPIGTSPSFLSTSPAIILMQRGITIEVRGLNIERTSPNEAQRLTILSSKPLYQNKLVINETEALITFKNKLFKEDLELEQVDLMNIIKVKDKETQEIESRK